MNLRCTYACKSLWPECSGGRTPRALNNNCARVLSGLTWRYALPKGKPWHSPDTEVWYSPRCKELLGYQDAEFPNVLSSWESHLHPEDRDRVIQAIVEHIERKKLYDIEYRLRTKSGEYRWFSARGQAIWDSQGRLTRMAGSLRDKAARSFSAMVSA